MAKSIKIGSLWIELSEDNHLDAPQSEPSTIRDERPEQQTSENSDNKVVVNSKADDMMIDDDNEVELVKSTDNQIILENNCNNQISSVPPPNVCQGNITSKDSPKVNSQHKKNEIYTNEKDKPKKIRLLTDIFNELDSKNKICQPKKKISQCKTSKLQVDEWSKKTENIISTIEVKGKMKASDNHEDDNKLSIVDKGKSKIDEINEDSDSSSSWNEEKLANASHSQLFPRDPLLYGEGASKFFEEVNIQDTIEEYEAIDDDDDDDIVMDEDDEIFGYSSMCFDSETDEDEEEELKKNPKKRKWGKD